MTTRSWFLAMLLGWGGCNESPLPGVPSLLPDGDAPRDLSTAQTDGVSSDLVTGHADLLPRCPNFVLEPAQWFATGRTPGAVVIGDLDGDGIADLVTANGGSGTVSVLRGLGGRSFAARVDYGDCANAASLALADYNGDGRLDVAASGNDLCVLLNQGSGILGSASHQATGRTPRWVVAGDLDGDGRTDLATANSDGNTVSTFLNGGGGNFVPRQDLPSPGAWGLALGDLDGDGRADLVAGPWMESMINVFLNRGGGRFDRSDNMVPLAPGAVDIGDVNGDGAPDIVAAALDEEHLSGVLIVLAGDGAGRFAAPATDVTGAHPLSVRLADLDGDGRPEAVTANLYTKSVAVHRNVGGGRFSPRVEYPAGRGPVFAAVGDLDGDGAADVAVADHMGDALGILFNRCQ